MVRGDESTTVYLYRGVLDMRVGIDRLSQKIKEESGRDVIRGGWYVFFSRKRERVRIFYSDRDGYALWSKRLEAGSFKVERHEAGYEELTGIDLRSILDGVELSRVRLRKKAERDLFQ